MSILLECQGLAKSFARKQALKATDLYLDTGGPIALVGPNGAGKTTFFSLLCGFLTASAGSARVLDKPLGSPELYGLLQALPQDALLDNELSIGAQLDFFARLQGFSRTKARLEAQRVLELMQLSEVYRQKPKALSHGMSKRVSIAQTLIGQPKLVLLDEPTAGIDPSNALLIRQLIAEQSQHINFIISSHNLAELEKLCQRVLFIDQGEMRSHEHTQHQHQDFIGLTLLADQAETVAALLPQLASFKQAQQKSLKELSIEYSAESCPDFDQRLLALLAREKIAYRSLMRGKSLEEQLF